MSYNTTVPAVYPKIPNLSQQAQAIPFKGQQSLAFAPTPEEKQLPPFIADSIIYKK